MEKAISVKYIYQQNLNFLVGSGASSGLFPTLWLPIQDIDCIEKKETFESLVTKLEAREKNSHVALMFMYYYKEIIDPVLKFSLKNIDLNHRCEGHETDGCVAYKQSLVINNYKRLIESLILLLNHKNDFKRRCNIFTTNYDGCFPFVADS